MATLQRSVTRPDSMHLLGCVLNLTAVVEVWRIGDPPEERDKAGFDAPSWACVKFHRGGGGGGGEGRHPRRTSSSSECSVVKGDTVEDKFLLGVFGGGTRW